MRKMEHFLSKITSVQLLDYVKILDNQDPCGPTNTRSWNNDDYSGLNWLMQKSVYSKY